MLLYNIAKNVSCFFGSLSVVCTILPRQAWNSECPESNFDCFKSTTSIFHTVLLPPKAVASFALSSVVWELKCLDRKFEVGSLKIIYACGCCKKFHVDVQAYHLTFQDAGEISTSQSDQAVCKISAQAGRLLPSAKITAAVSGCSCFAAT